MKILIKKYKIFLSIYLLFSIFIFTICFKKVPYSITTTGDITDITSFISVDNDINQSGSFNSIFVYSSDNVSVFQKWVSNLDKTATITKQSENYSQFTNDELNLMGRIQKNQSLEASTILAYEEAMKVDDLISIDYDFLGYIVRYKIVSATQFEIGDIITSINGINASDESFYNAYKTMFTGSNVTVIRNNKEFSFTLDDSSSHYVENGSTYSKISIYDKYKINSTTPKISIGSTNTLGPSAGLLQTLCIYNLLVEEDITKSLKIAGTGSISTSGVVGEIGGVSQKVIAAYKNKCDVFLCPIANRSEAEKKYNKLKTKMKFIVVSTFSEALEALKNV